MNLFDASDVYIRDGLLECASGDHSTGSRAEVKDRPMTRRESRWITVVIIALVVILRTPTLLSSLCQAGLTDEDYYSTIASDILDGGAVYHTAVDTKPPGIYYIFAGVFRVAGRNNFRAVHILAIIVVAATALVVRRIGARVADEW